MSSPPGRLRQWTATAHSAPRPSALATTRQLRASRHSEPFWANRVTESAGRSCRGRLDNPMLPTSPYRANVSSAAWETLTSLQTPS
eukprot:2650026-Alexandrium_andersonii.AAC.1